MTWAGRVTSAGDGGAARHIKRHGQDGGPGQDGEAVGVPLGGDMGRTLQETCRDATETAAVYDTWHAAPQTAVAASRAA